MKRIRITRTHSLGRDACHETAMELMEELIDRYGGDMEAHGYQISYSHPSGSRGVLESGEEDLNLDLQLGLMMLPMASKIRSELNRLCDERLTGDDGK